MLNVLAEEFSHEAPVAIEVLLVRLVGATILCGLIGLERQFRNNSAGLRTNMLIGLASAVFTLAGLQIMHEFGNRPDTVQIDPTRLIEAVTAGIAFLAAGVIFQMRGNVKGLTTGASMWLSGAIGLCVGLGMWIVAVTATGAGIIILWLLRKTEVAAGMKDE
ncbi:MgtC/SapB family protein [Neorhizobium galegae]|uniref:MgtC/SapB family protein n=1 Tax=Neorhizobium galegae TaxID=399 RepID=UPI00127CC69A|nr:MgtC/SapB family protein [Neorhizobium galegae]KAA9387544.1 MgtC/SapB family protein [Neorhizobium galegae]KAB1110222.1 MgtC/SapB family protein [Neorhizobium galegae]MCM2499205.1 MgtC/SapB family protein [Neorhizobium galegae]MCQ1772687.1 MgtC/SapB family protein [Neorhizobium galegae]